MVHEGFLCVFSVRERHSHVRTDEARTKEHILLDTNTGKTGLSTYGIKPHRQEQKDETRTKDERRKKSRDKSVSCLGTFLRTTSVRILRKNYLRAIRDIIRVLEFVHSYNSANGVFSVIEGL